MFKNIIKIIGGDPNKRDIRRYANLVAHINSLSPQFEALSDDALRAKSLELQETVQNQLREVRREDRKKATQEVLDEVLPEAFALVREASARTIGLRPYDVQLIGGMVLHSGRIAEMQTGEGKTLVATLTLYLNALTGRSVHLVTVNDYLARRDAKWMGPVFNLLGLSVGILQDASRTENAQKAFLFDPGRDSSQEDTQFMRMVERREAYAADIVYGTNTEFGFDYLRDNMETMPHMRRSTERHFAIIDEVDNILIDEARTPLIISGPAGESASLYQELAKVVKQLRPEHYEIEIRERSISLNDEGYAYVEELLGRTVRDPDRPEDLTPEQAQLISHLEQALRAEFIFKRNKDYLVQGGRVMIVDEHTGRVMPGRRWSDGLHQAVEAKEGVPIQAENVTYATITLQNFFRLYDKLAGMSGTALTEAEEFDKIYKLDVVPIPKNVQYLAQTDPTLEEREYRENGYKFLYIARKTEPDKPLWYIRKDYPDLVYRTEEAKLRAIVFEVMRRHIPGQPLLIGTTSVESSEHLSKRLSADAIRKLSLVLILRDAWFEANNVPQEGQAVEALVPFNKSLDSLSPSDMRPLAKELGVTLNPNIEDNIQRLLKILELEAAHSSQLRVVLENGIRHKVLNAKKHDEESEIIRGAGKLGAVTIATNMAGRGVDIKLGGDFDETVLGGVNRVLEKAGLENAFDMRHQDRLAALAGLNAEQFGIYVEDVAAFKKHMEDEQTVRALGGLHVIGSERHDARRIDNQLRGRAGRQGDPGSSRFYLSLEDELMKRFGGSSVSNLMQTLRIDDALPIEHGIVSRTIEQSQQRVEGYNFDVRKHLLEYDDVLNQQRSKIYGQRERIFDKQDLTDDIDEMLVTEVRRRVELAVGQDDGLWKLLAWLDEVQPTLNRGDNTFIFPFSIELILRQLKGLRAGEEVKSALLQIAKGAADSARDQLLQLVDSQLETYPPRVDERVQAKRDAADIAFEAAQDEARESGQPLEIRNVTKAMLDAAEISINLRKDFFANQTERTIRKAVAQEIEAALTLDSAVRFVNWVAARVGLEFKITLPAWPDFDWGDLGDNIRQAVGEAYDARTQRHLDEIAVMLDDRLRNSIEADLSHDALGRLLLDMAFGQSVGFNKRTHRKETRLSQRFPYIYYAAQLLDGKSGEQIAEDVLSHLRSAQQSLREFWGESELARLNTVRASDLDSDTQLGLRRALGDNAYTTVADQPLGALSGDMRQAVVDELGRQLALGMHRQLMLAVSTQLWVDYLTTIEGVRTSVSLEAYAQRDPLTAYKSKAFDLFQQLLLDMRAGVVNRLFTFRPRRIADLQAEVDRQPGGSAAESPRRALGRNDPCWCGSGKKYKNCHMKTDQN